MVDAELFAAYLKAAQDRLRELFIHGPFDNEKIMDSLLIDADYSQKAQANSSREISLSAENETGGKVRCTLISSQEAREQNYRAIVSRDGYADAVCIDCRNFPTAFHFIDVSRG
jgi:hypothetical protein